MNRRGHRGGAPRYPRQLAGLYGTPRRWGRGESHPLRPFVFLIEAATG